MARDRTPVWAAMVRGLFAPGIAVRCVQVPDAQGELFPVESDAITRARAPRREEFTAGRTAARHAMADLGEPAQAIAMDADRAPVWPAGLVGSISHAGGKCVAILASARTAGALAVDIEDGAPLPRDMWDSVLRSEEMAWLTSMPGQMRGRLAKRIFSAKECAYKCQFPLTRTLLEFQDFQISLAPEHSRFEAEFQKNVGPFRAGFRLIGSCAEGHGIVASGMTLPSGAPSI